MSDNPENVSSHAVSPEQGAGYARLAAVASPAPCRVHGVHEQDRPIRFLRLPEVIARVGLRRASIYLHIADGTFPKQISLGPRAVGWLEHEIDAWIAARIRAGRRTGSV
jgi:prophage regulatory protein